MNLFINVKEKISILLILFCLIWPVHIRAENVLQYENKVIFENRYNEFSNSSSNSIIAFFQESHRVYFDDPVTRQHRLYLFNTSSEDVTLITNSSTYRLPWISGNIVPWVMEDDNDTEIMYYNISSGENIKITNNTYMDRGPSVYNDIILWRRYTRQDTEIIMYNLTSGEETQITDDDRKEHHPRYSDEIITWAENEDGDKDIFIHNISTGRTSKLSFNDWEDYKPLISDGVICWRTYYEGEYGAVVYNLSSGVYDVIPIEGTLQPDSLRMTEGRLVWDTQIRGKQDDIFIYNIKQHEFIQFHDNHSCSHPVIYQDIIVWTRYDDDYGNIWMYNYTDETLTAITEDSNRHARPEVCAGTGIIYWWQASSSADIAYRKLNWVEVEPESEEIDVICGTDSIETKHSYWEEFKFYLIPVIIVIIFYLILRLRALK